MNLAIKFQLKTPSSHLIEIMYENVPNGALLLYKKGLSTFVSTNKFFLKNFT